APPGACGDDNGDDKGGDDDGGASDVFDGPDDASQDEFCAAFTAAFEPLAGVDEDPTEEQFEAFQDAVEDFGDVGTPDGIGDTEREGFEVFVEAIDGVDYDDVKDLDGDDGFPGVDADDEDKVEAFFTYASTTCIADSIPSDVTTE
ncbi:hypothetical protein, partial [Nocardioides stalactiti]|uniref:hypothetical protein n=1 Tax=Nocardioides stalactiti TaxID=2755356 RepID=UPI001602A845